MKSLSQEPSLITIYKLKFIKSTPHSRFFMITDGSVVPGDFSKRSWRLYTIVPGNLRFLISTSLIGTSPMLLGGTSFLIKMPLQHQRFANQKSEGFHLSGICKVTLIRNEITLIQINLHFDYKTICLMKSANNPLYLKY